MYNVLIVDDDFRDRNGICNTIKKIQLPLITFTADCGSEALNILKREKIDILITDIKMPDMLGTELAKVARKENPELTIILVSAHKDFQYAQSAIDFGAIKYLLKPYFIDELVAALNDAIEICHIKNKSGNLQSQERDSQTNNIILNYLNGDSNATTEQLTSVIGQDEIQLVLIKFLKTNNDDKKAIDKLKKLLAPSPTLITLPNSRYLILFKNKSVTSQDHFENIIEIFRNDLETEICITYSPFASIDQLPEEYKHITQTSEYFFFTNIGLVISTKDIISNDDKGAPSVDIIMDKIKLLIEMENYTDFIPMIALLFNTLKHTQHFSALYAKCISSNIINSLYKKQKFTISEQEILVKIFSSNSADEIVLLFKEIVEKFTANTAESDVHRLVSKTLNIIENDYMNDISLEYISEKLYISPSHLSRLFKKETGKNFIDFLKEYRLKKACELLKNTNIRITEISKMVGYDSTSYFTTIFHKFYNITPAQFREKGDN